MPNYNKVMLMGRLTRDPEVRYSANGTAITNIGLAVNRNWRNQDGQTQEEVTFVDVTAFGKRGEAVGQYLKKGRPIFIEGHLRMDQWDDKQTGQKRSKLAIIMDAFEFIDSRGEGEGGGGNFSGGGAPAAGGAAPAAGGGGGFAEDDDVPF
ncbi:MAG TPA: single-stranded DNA-binding protein [Verrucomicrobiales bacterium]|nr:single-stranded DNA-binding protein [Verrucomicrobiales bacterium]|tara:strand:- start:1760 stop:2212 length:453 start_codon:yes stop_codon:yes gene_type:complete